MGGDEACLRSEAPSCRGDDHSMMTNDELSAVRAFQKGGLPTLRVGFPEGGQPRSARR